ncbi:MAG TPA: hypothetical protein VMF53_03945 [Alphaproteobacteria bacterium]|nr:hypothetical protein [Alphaproteobacteria bacterium]
MADRDSPQGSRESGATAPPKPAPAGKRPAQPRGNPFIVLLAVLVGVGLLYWFTTAFIDWNNMQTCVSYGGHNCSPRVPLNN